MVVLEIIPGTWDSAYLSQLLSLCCLCKPHLSQGQLLSARSQLISGASTASRPLQGHILGLWDLSWGCEAQPAGNWGISVLAQHPADKARQLCKAAASAAPGSLCYTKQRERGNLAP